MIKTKTWIIIIAAILLLSVGAIIVMNNVGSSDCIANIYVDGECVKSIDLSTAEEDTFVIETENGNNTVEVQQNKIRIVDADCPDQTCVKMGWISGGGQPIVCLPHKLVIKLEGNNTDNNQQVIDSVTR